MSVEQRRIKLLFFAFMMLLALSRQSDRTRLCPLLAQSISLRRKIWSLLRA
jgi:hypothetical protein